MKKFCFRRWRGNGQIIPDIVKDKYYDYPKYSMNRNARVIALSECIVKVITEKEYLEDVLSMWGPEVHDKKVKQYRLGKDKLINKDNDKI